MKPEFLLAEDDDCDNISGNPDDGDEAEGDPVQPDVQVAQGLGSFLDSIKKPFSFQLSLAKLNMLTL